MSDDRIYTQADLEAAVSVVRAEAWDKGYTAGHSNAMRKMSDEPNAPKSPNPHRALLASSPAEPARMEVDAELTRLRAMEARVLADRASSPAEGTGERCQCGHLRRGEHYTDSISDVVMCAVCECREFAPVSSGEAHCTRHAERASGCLWCDMAVESLRRATARAPVSSGEAGLTVETAPLGTFAPAYNGGGWTRVERGWQWNAGRFNAGSTFPRPGGDWTGRLVAPAPVVTPSAEDGA